MNKEDSSLCLSCVYSGCCGEMTDNLVAYICDAYEPEGLSDEKWHEWTSCQMYGHIYEEDGPHHFVCRDCFDSYDEV